MEGDDRDLIADLYRAFAPYERPDSFIGCPCGGCWGGLGDRIGFDSSGAVVVPAPGGGRALSSLDESDLDNFVETVPGTSGDVKVYKHYLPRILEILAEGGWQEWPEADDVWRNLQRSVDPPWPEWPEAESSAIRGFVQRFEEDDAAEDRAAD